MSNDPMKPIFVNFARLLKTRLVRTVPTTEDSVRYTLFASLLRYNVEPNGVILEFPHPAIPRAKIDTWLPDFQGRAVAIEFKCDRGPPGRRNSPTTQKTGALFADFRRLQLLSHLATTYLVYVTTNDMDAYFIVRRHGHRELYELSPGNSLEVGKSYFADKPPTFLGVAGGSFEASITVVLGRRFAGHYLKVYNVNRT